MSVGEEIAVFQKGGFGIFHGDSLGTAVTLVS
jgi:hypothetical protein